MQISNKATFSVSSGHAPSLVSYNGNMYMAWTDTNGHLNIGQVAIDEGGGFTLIRSITFNESSTHAPSLMVFNGGLYMAWAGRSGRKVHIAPMIIGPTDEPILLGKAVDIYNASPVYVKNTDLGNTAGPVLFTMMDNNTPVICVIWKNTSDQLNILKSVDASRFVGPGDWGSSLIVFVNKNSTLGAVTSSYTPGCCSGGNIVWAHSQTQKLFSGVIALGTGNSLASIYNYNDTIYNYEDEFFNGITSSAPAIVPKGTKQDAGLFIGWKGEGSDDQLYLVSVYPHAPQPIPPTEAIKLNETSDHSPALCLLNDAVYMAWATTGSGQLNIGLVTE